MQELVAAYKVVAVGLATGQVVVLVAAAPTAWVVVGCQAALTAARAMQVAFALAGKVVVQKQAVADPYLPALVEILRDSSLRSE